MGEKCGKRSFVGDNDDADQISRLSDDILVHILSRLSSKEAARTCVLSLRWINLWKYFAPLDFDADSDLEEISKQPVIRRELINSVGRKYVKRVDSVVQSHKSSGINEFRIRFPLNASATDSINRWLEFAFSRQVQMLELDFHVYHDLYERYSFPEELLVRSSVLYDFKSLKSLSFKNVNVSGGAIEFFLRNCLLLEQLIVHCPGKISKLEVCGSSLVLKHLEIVHCSGLESLKVSTPNLTSLKVTSSKGITLENVPLLVDVSVSCEDELISLIRLQSVLSCCISQLETLYLVLVRGHNREQIDGLSLFPQMPKLKKLVIEYDSCDNESLIRFACLTQSSPYLHELVFKNKWFKSWMKLGRVDNVDANINFGHHHLKVFKFCGYYGRPSENALVRCILENCLLLEKIVLDPSAVFCRDRLRLEQTARKNAMQHVRPHLPDHVELVIF